MSEGQSALILPPNVVSKADVARLVVELERVDNELTTNAVRSKVGAEPAALPPMSQQLVDFLQGNKLAITGAPERTGLLRQLHVLKDTLPVVHMTFAVEADRESLGQIALWLRESVHPQAVIEAGLQPGLVAGVYLRTTNRVFDLSLRGALKGGRDILTSELRHYSGRA